MLLCCEIPGGVPDVWRLGLQDAAIREHTERLSAAAQAARQLVRKQDTVLKERVEQVCFASLVHPNVMAAAAESHPGTGCMSLVSCMKRVCGAGCR